MSSTANRALAVKVRRAASKFNLPSLPAALVGRERELASLGQLVLRPDVRLVTLTGPGGVGKTSLAIRLSANLEDDFEDGVCFCSLAPTSDPTLVVAAISQALDLKDASGWFQKEQLQDYLRESRLLLILDNFEQVVEAAPLLAELLTACPHLKMVVTSRAVLRVRSEYEFPVLPLPLPNPNRPENSAVELFIQRARAVRPGFATTDADLNLISQICIRLDGLPLAIELAAARIKLLPLPVLLSRLEGNPTQPRPNASSAPSGSSRLEILSGGARDLPARQQTMRQTIRWSYNLLGEAEKQLFRCLGVFVGGCTMAAAEAVLRNCFPTPPDKFDETPFLDLMTALVDNSLAQLFEAASPEDEPRIVMLEVIRDFSRECLEAAGEKAAVRQAHLTVYLELAEASLRGLNFQDQLEGWKRLEREQENFRAARVWAQEHRQLELLLRLGAALWPFWQLRGLIDEGRRWLDEALVRAENAEELHYSPVRAAALHGAGTMAYYQNDFNRCKQLCQESLEIYTRLDDKPALVEVLMTLATADRVTGYYTQTYGLYERIRGLYRELGNQAGVADTYLHEALTYNLHGEYAKGYDLAQKGLQISKETGNRFGIIYSMSVVGTSLAELGEPAKALELLRDEALPLSNELGNRSGSARLLNNSAYCLLLLGDYPAALTFYEEALQIHREMGNRLHVINSLRGFATLALKLNQPWLAARLFGAVEGVLNAIPNRPEVISLVSAYVKFWEETRQVLGEAEYQAAYAEGGKLSLDEALAAFYAAGLPLKPVAPVAPDEAAAIPAPQTPVRPEGRAVSSSLEKSEELTERELEVLRLIAQGLTNSQIADRMTISPHTVSTHLRSIYGKLNINTRSAATRYALEHRLN